MSEKERQLSFQIPESLYQEYSKYILDKYGIKPNGNKSIARDIRCDLMKNVFVCAINGWTINPIEVIDNFIKVRLKNANK